jgi:hypothetical protein
MAVITLKALEDAYYSASFPGYTYTVRDGIKAVIEKLISDAPDEEVLLKVYSEANYGIEGLLAVRNYILGSSVLKETTVKSQDDVIIWRRENENLHKQLRAQQDELRRLQSIVSTIEDSCS